MKGIFADTSFYIAPLNARDVRNAKAVAHVQNYHGRVATTDYILIEVGNLLSRVGDRTSFFALMSQLKTDPALEVVPGTRELFEKGYELYRARPDKEWSLTDCTSFVVMERLRIAEAPTADHHFEQAGFKALLV